MQGNALPDVADLVDDDEDEVAWSASGIGQQEAFGPLRARGAAPLALW